jgi:integrase
MIIVPSMKKSPLKEFNSAPEGEETEFPPVTVNEMLDKYAAEVVIQHADTTQKDYAWHLGILRKHFGHMMVTEVKPRHIGRFLDSKAGKVSRNRSAAVLSAAFTKAVGRWYMCDRNPCIGVERNATKARDRYITDAEYKSLYDTMPDRMQVAMDLALLTGQRQGDLLRLTWAQVLPNGIYFRQGKTGKRLIVEMTPALEAVLLRARRIDTGMARYHLVRTRDGAKFTSEGFRANWQRYMRLVLKRGLIKSRYTFHDLRAKCVSETLNITDAMHRAGHTSMQMTRSVYDRATRRVTALR